METFIRAGMQPRGKEVVCQPHTPHSESTSLVPDVYAPYLCRSGKNTSTPVLNLLCAQGDVHPKYFKDIIALKNPYRNPLNEHCPGSVYRQRLNYHELRPPITLNQIKQLTTRRT